MMKLIRNQIRTPDGTVLRSLHVHDYKTYIDKNGKKYIVDGGLEYLRHSANGDEIDESLCDDAPHEVQREVLLWGTYGKDGNHPLKRIAICDMETEHIQAVLAECQPSYVFLNCMKKELKLRGVT